MLLAAGFCPLQAQSSASDLQIPLVDRLPKWYYEQAPNQAIGISLSGTAFLEEFVEPEYEQAICFALINAALQQSDTNVVRGNVISVSESSFDMQNDVLNISATMKIPVHYVVLDQCRLKNGIVLVLLQYQYRNLSATESLEFVYECHIGNDSVSETRVIENEGQYGFYGQSAYAEDGYFLSLSQTRVEPFLSIGVGIPLDMQQYGNVLRNEYLLHGSEFQKYIGWLYFDALRQDLYRKLMYRQYN